MTMPSMHDIYIVDVCGTLVREDTTLGLLRHHFARIKSRPIRYMLFIAMTARLSPLRWVFVLTEKLTGKYLLKHLVVRMLVGDKVAALNQSANAYAVQLLLNRRVPSVSSMIDTPLLSGRVLLASASLEPVVASLALLIGARYVASALEEKNGLLTGRYAIDLTGRKEQALVDKFGSGVLVGQVCAISDNFSDRPLLENADRAYVVLHRESHRKRWHGLDVIFLKVDE